jgi:hypothetical protein
LATESYTNNPLAGLAIAFMDDILILGISNPLLVAVISNAAEASGLVVPIPMLCENECLDKPRIKTRDRTCINSNFFFRNHFFDCSLITELH